MIDKVKVEQAVRLFLEGIGEDPDREGLKGTCLLYTSPSPRDS